MFRDTLLYTRPIHRWTGTTVGGVAVPAAAGGTSPLPSPERANLSMSIMVSGQLRCTIFDWRGKALHITRRGGREDVRALRFQRAALGFQRAASIDVFADPEPASPASADAATRTWRVSTLVKLEDGFLQELLFP